MTHASPFWNESRRRRWTRVALFLLALYVLTAGVIVACEDRIAFPGWTFGKANSRPPGGVPVEEVAIRASDGNSLQGWWLRSPAWTPERGAVIYLHGNSENLSQCGRSLVRWRDELQKGVLGFDYPGFGTSTGQPNEQSCYAASQAAFEWLVREKKVAPRDIIVVGQSMGGAMAVDLAGRQRCRMLITSGAFSSFPEMAQHRFFWMPARWLVRSRFDNLGKIGRVGAPVFIAHGAADHVVPYAQGEQLFAAARAPKRFYSEPGQHHAQPKSRAFFEAVRAFLQETE